MRRIKIKNCTIWICVKQGQLMFLLFLFLIPKRVASGGFKFWLLGLVLIVENDIWYIFKDIYERWKWISTERSTRMRSKENLSQYRNWQPCWQLHILPSTLFWPEPISRGKLHNHLRKKRRKVGCIPTPTTKYILYKTNYFVHVFAWSCYSLILRIIISG